MKLTPQLNTKKPVDLSTGFFVFPFFVVSVLRLALVFKWLMYFGALGNR
jgi:hypothetical protein